MKTQRLLSIIAASGVALAATAALAQNAPATGAQPDQPAKDRSRIDAKEQPKHDGLKIGDKAPEFTLTDTEGKTVSLADLTRQKKIVVLEWFNADCPYVKKHHTDNKTMHDTAKAYADKGVVWFAVNSGAPGKQGAGLERNREARKEFKMNYPVLLDEGGEAAWLYQAKTTPTMYIINADGVLVYWGGIDNDASVENVGKVNYVKKALDEVLAGQTVTEAKTRSYGCTVKAAPPKDKRRDDKK